MDLSPGAVIAGRYRVDQKVGAGGMGEVWAGEHLSVGVRVAVKTLLPAAALNHEVVARFKREAYLLGRIRSDHVARVLDFIADETYGLVLVMELIEGDPLSRVLQERMLNVEETIDLGTDIGHALCDLHRAHIVHRDLKPGNIILQPLPEGGRRAVVVDFGVSRLIQEGGNDEEEITGITRADMAVGTIEYMAPEQILSSRDVTTGSDLYAVGAILFRAAAGRHVFGTTQSDTELAQKKLTTEAPQLPLVRKDKLAKGLQTVVARALKRRPAERYKKAEELLRDIVPLHDLAHLEALESMDETTQQEAVPAALVEAAVAAVKGEPSPSLTVPMPPQTATPISAASISTATPPSAPSLSASSSSLVVPPRRRGVSTALTLAAIVVAVAGGGVLGSIYTERKAAMPQEAAAPPATAAALPSSAATALPSVAQGAPSGAMGAPINLPAVAVSASAGSSSASAGSPTASASAAAGEVDLGELPDAPDAGPTWHGVPLQGHLPKPVPTASATAAPTAAATATAAPAAAATAAATASPQTTAPSSAPKATAAPAAPTAAPTAAPKTTAAPVPGKINF